MRNLDRLYEKVCKEASYKNGDKFVITKDIKGTDYVKGIKWKVEEIMSDGVIITDYDGTDKVFKREVDVLYQHSKKESVHKENFSEKEMQGFLSKLKSGIKAPFVNGQVSTLGGKDRASVMLTISVTPKKDWSGSYLENSQYGKFRIDYDGVIEMSSGTLKPYMRKSRFKDVNDLLSKMNKYIGSVSK